MAPFLVAILFFSCIVSTQARVRPVEHPVLDESELRAVPCPTKKRAHGKDCVSGKCLFRGCTEPTDCGGGKCMFVECEAPACSGGGCTFKSCHEPTCVGGLCTFIDTQTTLADGYCAGGEWLSVCLSVCLSWWSICLLLGGSLVGWLIETIDVSEQIYVPSEWDNMWMNKSIVSVTRGLWMTMNIITTIGAALTHIFHIQPQTIQVLARDWRAT